MGREKKADERPRGALWRAMVQRKSQQRSAFLQRNDLRHPSTVTSPQVVWDARGRRNGRSHRQAALAACVRKQVRRVSAPLALLHGCSDTPSRSRSHSRSPNGRGIDIGSGPGFPVTRACGGVNSLVYTQCRPQCAPPLSPSLRACSGLRSSAKGCTARVECHGAHHTSSKVKWAESRRAAPLAKISGRRQIRQA